MPAARRRFQREAQMASSLNHPHIVTVHDAGEIEGRQYLVTEYVDGGTLKDWAKPPGEKAIAPGGRSWNCWSVWPTAWRCARSRDSASRHQAGQYSDHQERLCEAGGLRAGETGGATPAPDEATRTLTEKRTRPGVVVGTIAYMSPEQASGRPLDARSDIFSFGVVLYQMLAGRRPFEGATDLEALQTIIHGTPQPLPEDVPAALRGMVEKALEKDPAERYQSMREMVVDLRRLMRPEWGSGSAPRRIRAPTGGGPRRSILLALVAGGAVLCVPDSASPPDRLSRSTPNSPTSPTPPPRRRFRRTAACLRSFEGRARSSVRDRFTSSFFPTGSRCSSRTTTCPSGAHASRPTVLESRTPPVCRP